MDLKNKKKELEKQKKRNKKKITIPDDMELCPFMSTPDHEVACTPKCALYKGKGKKGYHCPLTELTSISWVLKGSPNKNFRKY